MLQNICVMKYILPHFLGNRLTPRTVALALCWQSSLVVLFGYVLIISFALLGDLNLVRTTLSYFADVYPALSPLIDVALSHWLLYSYFHYVAAPLAEVVFQGSTLNFLAGLALCLFVLVFGTAAAEGMFDLGCGRNPSEYFHRTDPLRKPAFFGQLPHLSVGWTHGHHPPILYE